MTTLISKLKELSWEQNAPTINIAIVGQVSSGKSTTLNSMFIETYNETKRKRATCSINMYVEAQDHHTPHETILAMNTAQDKKINDADFKLVENHYRVPQIKEFGKRNPLIHYNIIDLPGLNDRSVDTHFRKYIDDNFKYFDVLIFITDGNSSMNTDSEKKLICEFLDKMVKHSHIKLIVGLSKVDDPDDEETEDVCKDAEKFILKEGNDRKLKGRIHITSFSAENGYLLRYLKYKGKVNGLSDKNISKLASLLVGSKWRKDILGHSRRDGNLNDKQKDKIAKHISEIISDGEQMAEYYTLCNYDNFIRAFDVIVTDDLQNIYEGKILNLVLENTQPGWKSIPRIKAMFDAIVKRFPKVGDAIIKSFICIIFTVMMSPGGKKISDMNLSEIKSHLVTYTAHLDKDISPINKMSEKTTSQYLMIEAIKDAIVKLTINGDDDADVNYILEDRILGKYINPSDRLVIIHKIFNECHDFRADYDIVVKYMINNEIVMNGLFDNIITDWFTHYPEDEPIDFQYQRRKCYRRYWKVIERHPLLDQLMVLLTISRSVTVKEIVEHCNHEYSESSDTFNLFVDYCKMLKAK